MQKPFYCLRCKSEAVAPRYDHKLNIEVVCKDCGQIDHYHHKSTLLQGKRVVVVDDNVITLSIFEDLLTEAGFEVLSTTSGETAIDLILNHHPDVAILDNNLPDRSGLDVSRHLRSRGCRSRLIMFTGDTYDGIDQEARESGIDQIFHKGANLTDMIREITEMVV